jgi:hypothetical protein
VTEASKPIALYETLDPFRGSGDGARYPPVASHCSTHRTSIRCRDPTCTDGIFPFPTSCRHSRYDKPVA